MPSEKSYMRLEQAREQRGPAAAVLAHLKRGEAVALWLELEMDDAADVAMIWATVSARAIDRFVRSLIPAALK